MTIRELRQYRSIRIELDRLEREKKSRELSDTVIGSDRDFPYTQHKMSVSGLDSDGDNMRLLERIHNLRKQKKEIEDFIYGIEDSLTRQIFEWRYIKGKGIKQPSWQFIAFKIEETDEQFPRRKHNEFLEKLKLDENDEN